MDTECEEKHSWDFQLEETWFLPLVGHRICVHLYLYTQHPLFTFGILGWGPMASSFDHPLYTHGKYDSSFIQGRRALHT